MIPSGWRRTCIHSGISLAGTMEGVRRELGSPTRAMGRTLAFVAALCSVVLFSMISGAGASTPTEEVRVAIDEAVHVLNDEALKGPGKAEERWAALRKIADERFDFEEMAKRSLARHWRERTPEERKEFVSLYSDLLWKSYINIVEKYDNEKVEYLGETVRSPYAEVKTKVITKSNHEISVDFRLLNKSNGWMTYDLSIQGVSLINNYRTQFNEIIVSSSYTELVRRLKDKLVSADIKVE